jgi:hypothetical protein
VPICWRYQRFCRAFIHVIFADSSKGVCPLMFTVSVVFRDQILYRYYKRYLQFRLSCDMLERYQKFWNYKDI